MSGGGRRFHEDGVGSIAPRGRGALGISPARRARAIPARPPTPTNPNLTVLHEPGAAGLRLFRCRLRIGRHEGGGLAAISSSSSVGTTSTATPAPSGEIDRAARPGCVALVVDLDPEPRARRATAARTTASFSPTPGGEHDRVGAAERGAGTRRRTCGCGGSRRASAQRGRLRRRSAARACTSRRSFCPGQPEQPAALVEQPVDLVDAHARRRDRWKTIAGSMSPERVPITRPSSGVSPIDVSTLRPPLDRGRARAVAEVQHDQVDVSASGAPEQPAACARDVRVRGAVEPVAPDAVLLGDLRSIGVGVGMRRQRLVERGVEDGDVRDVRERRAARTSMPSSVGRVVQRGERRERVGSRRARRRRSRPGLAEPRAAVHDPVADRCDSRSAAELASSAVAHGRARGRTSRRPARRSARSSPRSTAARRRLEVDQLVLHRRRAAVEDERRSRCGLQLLGLDRRDRDRVDDVLRPWRRATGR